MPVESATFINDLDASNPVHTDGLNQADAHLRLLKDTIKNTFPNIDAAVTGTPTKLNNATSMTATAGLLDIPQQSPTVGAKVILTGAADTGGDVTFQNTASAAAAGALTVAVFSAANDTPHSVLTGDYTGNIVALASLNAPLIKQSGYVLMPTGGIILWSGSAAAIPSGWLLCDGSNGTPDLRDKFVVGASGAYAVGATGGATSAAAGVTNSTGAHDHGASTGLAGVHNHGASTTVAGAHAHGALTDYHALSVDELPSHQFHIALQTDGGGGDNGIASSSAGIGGGSQATDSVGSNFAHAHGLFADGDHGHGITIDVAPNHAHSIDSAGTHNHTTPSVATLPPYFALCYIMKS